LINIILYNLKLALIGILAGMSTSIVAWFLIRVSNHGIRKAVDSVKELGPFYTGKGLSSIWWIKTGALPGGIIGLIASPFLGPIIGEQLMPIIIFFGNTISYNNSVEAGSLLIGLLAGIIGYFLRLP